MIASRAPLAVLLSLLALPAPAGHGFMNSFADIEWLPEPGLTPDHPLYFIDTAGERVLLFVARFGGEPLQRALAFGKEKIAEANAMIRIANAPAASRALRHHERYVARAGEIVTARASADHPEPRYVFINAVLEHVYILSVEYLDMPLDVRREALTPWFAHTMTAFAAERDALSPDDRAALFFKEEEIRWSLEMVTQADAQGITNE